MNPRTNTVSSTLEQYLWEIQRVALLTVDEEQRLARAFRDHGDKRAGHRLIEANLRFVVKVAFEYRSYGLHLPDLIQEGNVGLMKGVQKFDPDKRIRLISYAVWWIRAYIQNHVLKSWSLVKIGTTQAQRKLEGRDCSLDAPMGDGTSTYLESTASDGEPQRRHTNAAQPWQALRVLARASPPARDPRPREAAPQPGAGSGRGRVAGLRVASWSTHSFPVWTR